MDPSVEREKRSRQRELRPLPRRERRTRWRGEKKNRESQRRDKAKDQHRPIVARLGMTVECAAWLAEAR